MNLAWTVLILSAIGFAQEPASTPSTRKKPKAVIFSLDAAQPGRVCELMAQGEMPFLAKKCREGVPPSEMQPPTPSLTPVAHATMLTGAHPDKTGILAITFRRPGDALGQTVSGFAQPSEAETLVSAARRQGLTVASISWPGIAPGAADWTVQRAAAEAASSLFEPKAADWSPAHETAWSKEKAGAGRPVLETRLQLKLKGETRTLYVFAAGASPAGYDELFIDSDEDPGNGYLARLETGKWASIGLSREKMQGAWVKLLALSADLSQAKLYVGSVFSTGGSPESFVREETDKFGFFPGNGDYPSVQAGRIDEQTYREQEIRVDDWHARIARDVRDRLSPDLLLVYQESIDGFGHRFNLRDPRQRGYSPEKAAEYQAYIQEAYRKVDERIAHVLDDAKAAAEANVFVVSDHGMAPVHTRVHVARALKADGLAVDLGPAQQVQPVASGGALNVYVHRQGRDPSGADEIGYDRLREKVILSLKSLKDHAGEPVFDVVRKKEELIGLQLLHRNSGDVVAIAKPGYYLDSSKSDAGAISEASPMYGMHGYDSTLREMQALFMAWGPAIRKQTQALKLRSVDLAATVAATLGIDAPKDSDGAPLKQALK